MNKVVQRCQKDACAKFLYASNRMFFELKILKVVLYVLAIIPVILQLTISSDNETLSFMYTLISFALTILNELLSTFLNNHKEKAILESQLYWSEITGSTFSKIEYDREMTNDLNELAIRKGLPAMHKSKEYPTINVPDEISDDYSYLYISRKNAANTNYILSRLFVMKMIILAGVVCLFAAALLKNKDTATSTSIKLIIGFYPLVIPIIRDAFAAKKCQKNCAKICADIDNFFADGDDSVERLARFYFYVQNIEFEMMLNKPAVFSIYNKLCGRGTKILADGVTMRFKEAILELKVKSKGLINQPHGRGLITKVEYDYKEIEEKAKAEKKKKALTKTITSAEKKPERTSKPAAKSSTKTATKSTTKTATKATTKK